MANYIAVSDQTTLEKAIDFCPNCFNNCEL